MSEDLLGRAALMQGRGQPFALATVVRCEAPTSAKPGAKAVVLEDGTIAGWVGGACAEPVVVREALAALRDGRPRLVALVGDAGSGPRGVEGLQQYPMTCHSGGTLEIYIEPYLPRPSLVLIGRGPVIEALASLGRGMDYAVVAVGGDAELGGVALTPRSAVVVATHGEADEAALARVLESDAGYVSLIASRRRAAVIVETLRQRGLPAEQLGRLRAPAGLDIGATAPAEIAVSILAEIIQHRRSEKPPVDDAIVAGLSGPTEARDPVCGMQVEIASAPHRSEHGGTAVYFCCRRCKELFDEAPARYPLIP